MSNKEQIARWRKLHKRTRLGLTHEIAGLMLDMLEQQQAEIDELTQERDEIAAHYSVIYLSAKGLAHGKDWNKGTHAIEHGHRARLIEAVSNGDKAKQLLAQRDLEQQLKGVEDALRNIPETRHGNWPMALVRKYVIDMRQKVKNGGE